MGCFADAVEVYVPCKDCTDRKLGCHDKCSKYQEFKAKRKTLTDQKNEYYKTSKMFEHYFRCR